MRRATWLALAPLLLVTSCSENCRRQPSLDRPVAGAEDNTRDPVWILPRHTPRADVAIVFLHGIFGDTLGTWTHSEKVSFFSLLNSDPALGGPVDMFAFGYTSNMIAEGSFTIDEAARRLRERLEYHDVTDYPAIVFVAHSMGGLITLRTLLTYRDLISQVPLIALYATPQEGSQIAEIGQHISPNLALQEMIPGDKNRYLENLDNEWKEAMRTNPIPVVCAYEKLATYQIKIVPRGSATRYCTEPSDAIDADHISITKPDRAGHDAIVMLVNALNRYVVGKQWAPKVESPDFRRDGDRWLYTLSGQHGKQEARLVNASLRPLRYTIAELSDPGLYVWPDDTPRVVKGGDDDSLGFAVARNATLSDYEFVLRWDGLPEERVHVHVPDLAGQLQQQAAITGSIIAEINNQLGDPAERSKLMQAGSNVTTVTDAVIERARQATARAMPNAPVSMQWVITAEALNAANWSTLAVSALRKAEQASPNVTRLPSVARTAAWISASSGETQLFEKAVTPIVPDAGRIPVTAGLPAGVDVTTAAQLVARCKGIDALLGACLSLEGDVAASRGDTKAATDAFEAAARIRMTPTLSERLRRNSAAVTNVNRGAVVGGPESPAAPANPRAGVPR